MIHNHVLGCHICQCKGCGHLALIPHSCKSRFVSSELVEGCPACGKHATDVWANQVLNALLDVPHHQWKYQVTSRMKSTHREGQWRFAKSKDFLKQDPFLTAMLKQYLAQARVALSLPESDNCSDNTNNDKSAADF